MDKELFDIYDRLLNEHFPKGECKERGQAMVFGVRLIREIQKKFINSKKVKENKTPGQVAYEKMQELQPSYCCPWLQMTVVGQNYWEQIASAVIEYHEDGIEKEMIERTQENHECMCGMCAFCIRKMAHKPKSDRN